MSLTVNNKLLQATTCVDLANLREQMGRSKEDREVNVPTEEMGAEALEELKAAADGMQALKTSRALTAIMEARAGKAPVVPSFAAAKEAILAFLRQGRITGWVWTSMKDGTLYPVAVTSVVYDDGRSSYKGQAQPTIKVYGSYFGIGGESSRNDEKKVGLRARVFTFQPADFVRRRAVDAFASHGLYHETAELHAEHAALAGMHQERLGEFAEQFKVTGQVLMFEEEDWNSERGLKNRRVIHDLDSASIGPISPYVDCSLGKDDADTAPLPIHAVTRVFDLSDLRFKWVNTGTMVPYEYQKDIGDKLILPDSHRDLLDVLTGDDNALHGDLYDGKVSSGVILLTGAPGMGKTSTAEAYAEMMGRPLYSVHSGLLGTKPAEVAAGMKLTFERMARWNCPSSINECDVLVRKRGLDIVQNAIVAEILVAMESEGAQRTSFWSSNLPEMIDDAILSRCAGVIRYKAPGEAKTKAVWRVMSDLFDAKLDEKLIEELAQSFKSSAPREIKNLLRMTLRTARFRSVEADLALFKQCAMFRPIEFAGREAD